MDSHNEIITIFISGVFIAKSDIGVGSVVGASFFNIFFIIGLCPFFIKEVRTLLFHRTNHDFITKEHVFHVYLIVSPNKYHVIFSPWSELVRRLPNYTYTVSTTTPYGTTPIPRAADVWTQNRCQYLKNVFMTLLFQPIKLAWWPLVRDSFFYSLAAASLAFLATDQRIQV